MAPAPPKAQKGIRKATKPRAKRGGEKLHLLPLQLGRLARLTRLLLRPQLRPLKLGGHPEEIRPLCIQLASGLLLPQLVSPP